MVNLDDSQVLEAQSDDSNRKCFAEGCPYDTLVNQVDKGEITHLMAYVKVLRYCSQFPNQCYINRGRV